MKQIAPNTLVQSRYLVVQPIGKGGMGEVYLAIDQRLGSAVALKRTRFETDSPLGNAFEREARILARLRHPVLPKVIDHFNEGDGQFLVMEHISGDDLEKRLSNAKKPFPLSWVMFWGDQLLDALNYLHSHNPPIIHRDIKPQNLKLTDDNHIILLDFGLSKDFDTGSKEAPAAGSVVGYSPHFASMEQVRGTGTDARSDLYSLSATLYQLLSNDVPPDALTRAEAILGGQDDPLRPLSELNPEVSKPISDVILRGMSVRQDQRWPSAAEMQKALRRAVNAPKTELSEAKTVLTPPATVTQAPPTQAESQPAKTEPLPASVEVPTAARIHVSSPPADATAVLGLPATDPVPQSALKTQVLPSTTQPTPAAMAATVGTSRAAAPPPANPGKTSSKMPFVLGSLVGIVILAGAAGGGGWYYYNNFYKAQTAPTPSASPEPSPVPTINVVDSSTPAPVDAPPANTLPTTKEITTTEPQTKSSPQSVAKTGDSTKTTAPRATPKQPAKKSGDDRTVIMQ